MGSQEHARNTPTSCQLPHAADGVGVGGDGAFDGDVARPLDHLLRAVSSYGGSSDGSSWIGVVVIFRSEANGREKTDENGTRGSLEGRYQHNERGERAKRDVRRCRGRGKSRSAEAEDAAKVYGNIGDDTWFKEQTGRKCIVIPRVTPTQYRRQDIKQLQRDAEEDGGWMGPRRPCGRAAFLTGTVTVHSRGCRSAGSLVAASAMVHEAETVEALVPNAVKLAFGGFLTCGGPDLSLLGLVP